MTACLLSILICLLVFISFSFTFCFISLRRFLSWSSKVSYRGKYDVNDDDDDDDDDDEEEEEEEEDRGFFGSISRGSFLDCPSFIESADAGTFSLVDSSDLPFFTKY